MSFKMGDVIMMSIIDVIMDAISEALEVQKRQFAFWEESVKVGRTVSFQLFSREKQIKSSRLQHELEVVERYLGTSVLMERELEDRLKYPGDVFKLIQEQCCFTIKYCDVFRYSLRHDPYNFSFTSC